MSGYYGIPYRPPGGGWTSPRRVFLGGLSQHYDATLASVPEYTANYSVIQKDGISLGAPYERQVGAACGEDVPHDPDSEPWIGTSPVMQYTGLLDRPFPLATWLAAGRLNLSACEIIGFKNVQARRVHHGCPGWLDADGWQCDNLVCSDHTYRAYTASPNQTRYTSFSYSVNWDYTSDNPDGNWVDTSRGGISGSRTVNWQSGTLVNSASNSVDEYTQPYVATSPTQTKHVLNYKGWYLGMDGTPVVVDSDMTTVGEAAISGLAGCTPPIIPAAPDGAIGGNLADFINSWNSQGGLVPIYTGSPWPSLPAISTTDNYGSLTDNLVEATQTLPDVTHDDGSVTHYAVTVKLLIGWTKVNAGTQSIFTWKFGFDRQVTQSGAPWPGHMYHSSYGCAGTYTLDNPVTTTDVQNDADALLATWNLTDNKTYPWRYDGNTNIAPLVIRREVPGPVSPLGFNFPEWVDPAARIYDGAIYGQPTNPTAYGLPAGSVATGWFDPYYEHWVFAGCESVGSPAEWFQQGSGAFNTGQSGIPLTATHWTNEFEAANLPATGAWTFTQPGGSGQIAAGVVYRQKYCEVKMVWNSYDFAGPYGDWKFAGDSARTYCITGIDGGTLTVNRTATGEAMVALGDVVIVAGSGAGLDGVFSVAGVSDSVSLTGSTITLGTQLSPLPDGYTLPGNGTVAKLRFWSAPPFGVLPATAVVASGNTTLTFPASALANLVSLTPPATVSVDLYAAVTNSSGISVPAQTPLVSGVTLTRSLTDNTKASVSGSYATAVFVAPAGMKTWWDDTGTKSQWMHLEWVGDNRTNGEHGRLSGVMECDDTTPVPDGGTNYDWATFNATSELGKFVPCCPFVMCYSNNDSDATANWKNGKTLPIPVATLDYIYVSEWRGEVVQCVQELKWQAPPAPVCPFTDPSTIQWGADDGSCQTDSPPQFFYAYPTLMEPFLALPTTILLDGTTVDTAPDPYTGWGLPWKLYSPVTTNPTAVPADGTLALPATSAGLTPWQFYINACNCVRTGGRFAAQYESVCRKWAGSFNPGPDE